MAANQQFCLRWNNHMKTLLSVFDSLLENQTLVDCTLAAEGQYLNAHKVVLSACSPYLGVLLSTHQEKHPILILKDIKFQELKAMLDYMYRGEVNISQEQLCTFLKAAESLQIKGLTESAGLNPDTKEFEERHVKRYERKCTTSQIPNHNTRTRSPPSSNAVNTTTSDHSWSQKYSSSTNYRPTSPTTRRDGSLSPTARKRRKQQHPMSSSVEDPSTTTTTAAAATAGLTATSISLPLVENHQDTVDNVSSSNSNTLPSVNMNNIKTENTDKVVDAAETRSTDSGNSSTSNSTKANDLPVVPKQEPRFEDRHSDVEGGYEDSVEEMTIEDEEEEIDETDLSRPGPSHSEDSQTYGSSSYPLSSVNDGASGPLDCQEPITDPLAEQRFVCRLCGKLYQWKQSLTRHIREDRCDKGPQHACPRCGIIFKHTTRLNRHILFCPNVQLGTSTAVSGGGGGGGGAGDSNATTSTPSTTVVVEKAVNQVTQSASISSQVSTISAASSNATAESVALSSSSPFMSPTTTLT